MKTVSPVSSRQEVAVTCGQTAIGNSGYPAGDWHSSGLSGHWRPPECEVVSFLGEQQR